MKPRVTVAISLTVAAMAVPLMGPSCATARADSPFFQSQSGNIQCNIASGDGIAFAACEIRDYTYAPPPRPTPCMGGFGNRISIRQGSAPEMACHTDSLMGQGYPTLPYGQTRSVSPITCDSETSGMTCKDSDSGHYFFLSRENYEMH